jgi:hypothetical protein
MRDVRNRHGVLEMSARVPFPVESSIEMAGAGTSAKCIAAAAKVTRTSAEGASEGLEKPLKDLQR